MPVDQHIRQTVARWSLDEWRDAFHSDTIDWYLNLYSEADNTSNIPIVLVAFVDGEIAGTASVVADDELPGATEPGPWLASVFVTPQFRGNGVGTALVAEALSQSTAVGHTEIYLYTRSKMNMYQHLGFRTIRTAQLADHDVTVMVREN